MHAMQAIMLVALGGAAGSVARYAITLGAARWLGPAFPWGTLAVNVAGSFAMGLLLVWIIERMAAVADLRLLVATGFLGGFTTFSAFSFDILQLVERKAAGTALAYAGLSVILSIAAVFLGAYVARWTWP